MISFIRKTRRYLKLTWRIAEGRQLLTEMDRELKSLLVLAQSRPEVFEPYAQSYIKLIDTALRVHRRVQFLIKEREQVFSR